jgi:hypothetical protein
VGNNEGIKAIFSGHIFVLLLLRRNERGTQQPKGTNSPKAICAKRGNLYFLNLLEVLQRLD